MITFNVVKDQHGWAVRMGDRMTTPFWRRDLAIREAVCLADAIRRHGEGAEVIVESAAPDQPPERFVDSSSSRLDALLWGHWVGPQ